MSIEQQRVAIARFMGMEGTDKFLALNYMYEQSWNLLMPVVEKIEQTLLHGYKYTHDDKPASFRVAIFVRCCDICVANSTGDNLIEITAAPSKIEAVYNAVVQFIQWYNKQTTSTT